MPSSVSISWLVKVQILLPGVTAISAIVSAVVLGKSLCHFKWKCPLGATVSGNISYDSSNHIVYYEEIEWGSWSKCELVMYADVMVFVVEAIWWWFFIFYMLTDQDDPSVRRTVSYLHLTKEFASRDKQQGSLAKKNTAQPRYFKYAFVVSTAQSACRDIKLESSATDQPASLVMQPKWVLCRRQYPNMILPIILTKTTMITLCYASWITAETGLHDFLRSLMDIAEARWYAPEDLLNSAWINTVASTLKRPTPTSFYDSMTIFKNTRISILLGLKLQVLLALYQAFTLAKSSPEGSPTRHRSDHRHLIRDTSSCPDLERPANVSAATGPTTASESHMGRMSTDIDVGETNYVLLRELPCYPGEDQPENENGPRNPKSTHTEMSDVEEETPTELKQHQSLDIRVPSMRNRELTSPSDQKPEGVCLAISSTRVQMSTEPGENTWVNTTMKPSYVRKQESRVQSFSQMEAPGLVEIHPPHVMFKKTWKNRLRSLIVNSFHRKTVNGRSSEQMFENRYPGDNTDSIDVRHAQKGSGDSFGGETKEDDKIQE